MLLKKQSLYIYLIHIIQLLNKVYEGLNKSPSEYTLIVFLYLRKAFNTCKIDILIKNQITMDSEELFLNGSKTT